MSLSVEDCNDKLEDLTKHQLEVLHDWEAKFQEKYQVVGKVTATDAATPHSHAALSVSIILASFTYIAVCLSFTHSCTLARAQLCIQLGPGVNLHVTH